MPLKNACAKIEKKAGAWRPAAVSQIRDLDHGGKPVLHRIHEFRMHVAIDQGARKDYGKQSNYDQH